MPLLGTVGASSVKSFGGLANLVYLIRNSLRFRASASAYLSRTLTTPTNNKIFTYSVWVKRGALGSQQFIHHAFYGDSGRYASIYFTSSDTLQVQSGIYTTGASTSASYNYITTQVFRDPSAWYHIVLAIDTTQATASNRSKLYVNGTQQTLSGSFIPENTDLPINNTVVQTFGRYDYTTTNYFDGYIAETYLIDGQALTPSSFGETDTTTGSWKPKAYSGTYGTNGFYLKFSDIATTSGSNAGLGKDFSGNANYWTTNNISVTAGTTYDAMIDSPTLTSATVANYATLNPLNVNPTYASAYVASNGNLTVTATGITGVNFPWLAGTIAVNTGKWYWEVLMGTTGGGAPAIGIITSTSLNNATPFAPESWSYYLNGQKFAGATGSAYGATWTTGDLIGVALDCDAGTITFYKNNVSQGTAFSTGFTNLLVNPVLIYDASGTNWNCSINFGQRPFTYTPPTGFVALNTYNLPDSTIKKGNTVMDATLYAGNGGTQSITNAAGFKPDLVWVKSRTDGGSHSIQDSVRGVGSATKLSSNSTNAENNASADATDPIYGYLTAINSNGFTAYVGTTPSQLNKSGQNYVGWQWQAGQGSTSSNTSGTITSTVSVNATVGFSIVTYTGTGANATVGHGLGVAPKMVIVKNRTTSGDEWCVWHTSLTNATYYLYLNGTAAQAVDTTFWNSTAPSSTVISLGSNGRTNRSSSNMVCYAWAEIAGFSKFGSYTGNGSADGPFVYTGFRPKFVMYKSSSSAYNWCVDDTSRSPYNISSALLNPNLSAAENTGALEMDILSNGFKIKSSDATFNASGGTYIYMAFAENPFKNANAR
jgi:hypothetical protein